MPQHVFDLEILTTVLQQSFLTSFLQQLCIWEAGADVRASHAHDSRGIPWNIASDKNKVISILCIDVVNHFSSTDNIQLFSTPGDKLSPKPKSLSLSQPTLGGLEIIFRLG
ncbi:hypothetical protein KBI23_08005 [bacterium]|jgi:hypothetical protein|nr:hypothetical protein [bacterium]MBP9090957.1 hypothetical protein [bacterium]MBP9808959.1 hypothetical protein [bacterium]